MACVPISGLTRGSRAIVAPGAAVEELSRCQWQVNISRAKNLNKDDSKFALSSHSTYMVCVGLEPYASQSHVGPGDRLQRYVGRMLDVCYGWIFSR